MRNAMSEDLKPRKVKVKGKMVTVFKAPFVNGLQRSIRIANAEGEIPKFYEKLGLSEDVISYVHRLLYPSLISCSAGSLPSEEEFVKLYDDEANAWINAASEFNPDWFSLNGDAAKKDMEKKQSQQP